MLRLESSTLHGSALLSLMLILIIPSDLSTGCQFYPTEEHLKFVRVPENLGIGSDIFTIEVHPRSHLDIMPIDKEEDMRYFAYKNINKTHVSIVLAQLLEELVDTDEPITLLKFRLLCNHVDGTNSSVSSHLSVNVYVEDVNDHAPQFYDAPYNVAVEELSATGLTIFEGIFAFDKDKPNTPNSDVRYAITKGNEQGKFSLETGQKTALILKKQLDYDNGDKKYNLTVTASDRGSPPKSTNTSLIITVVDNDDLNPKFTQDVYRTAIFENPPTTSQIIHNEIKLTPSIQAIDQDRQINKPVNYVIVSGNERHTFHLDPHNGSLFLERPIDLDTERNLYGNKFVLQIQAIQTDNPLRVSSAQVEIQLLDLNDNLPEFEIDFYNISIVENLPNGFSVLQVMAVDHDRGENGEFTYELRDPSNAFAIDEATGWLTVQNQNVLDREKKSFLKMQVVAIEKRPSDVEPFNVSSSVDVQVTLLDANDNNPVFVPGNLLQFVAHSDYKAGTIIGQVHAVDKDLGINGLVQYTLQLLGNSNNSIPFAVDPDTGVITISENSVPEGKHVIFIEAADQPSNPSEKRSSLAVVTIEVLQSDGQESKDPDFVGAPYEFWVGGNVPVGTSIGQVRVNEIVKSKTLVYDLLHSYQEGVPFAVEERSGTITVVDDIKNYDKSSYDLEAVVSDENSLTLVTNVSIHVVDPSDENGIFTKEATKAPLIFHVMENAVGAFIGRVVPANISSSLKNVRFLIANQQDINEISITDTGALYTQTGLDREKKQNHSIIAIAESPRGVGVFQVTVIVDDEDDNAPIFSSSAYEGRILENSRTGTEVIMLNHISVRDLDEHANFLLTLEGIGSNFFEINQMTARIFYIGNSTDLLDREERPAYNLQIVAQDGTQKSSNASLTIQVEDENDNAPNFAQMIILPDRGIRVTKDNIHKSSMKSNSSKAALERNDHRSPLLYIPENVTIGVPIIRLVARDPDEGKNSEVTYNILSEMEDFSSLKSKFKSRGMVKHYFVMDSKTGEVSVAGALPGETDVTVEIIARDNDGLMDNITIRLHIFDVNDHAPIFKKSSYSFDVLEGVYTKLEFGKLEATDEDFGDNADVTYQMALINPDNSAKFEISKYYGTIYVTGTLDRESRDVYNFKVTARDNGTEKLYSSVDVELHITDLNDNHPTFYGYQSVGKIPNTSRNIDKKETKQHLVPVYYASLPENSPIGTAVSKVYANDSDFTGNGNGVVLFDLMHIKGQIQYFAINSKDGAVITVGNLDYETQNSFNLTITASDLGSPSLTSTALLFVTILDVDEGLEDPKRPTFQHKYYEVEVDENSLVPLKILDLNVSNTFKNKQIRYSIVKDDSYLKEYFSLDPKNGSLYLLISPDREKQEQYELRVTVDEVKIARGMPVMLYPVLDERLNGLRPNEAKIILRVKDINDNEPKFKSNGGSFLGTVPTSAYYGYNIIKIEAEDLDKEINSQIRYQILNGKESSKFTIDPVTGQVQVAGSFANDGGRVFSFDVKATDRAGMDDGCSNTAHVLVYVLDDNKQLVISMGMKLPEIQAELGKITSILQNITGLDIRVRKLEPHSEKHKIEMTSSDMYLYALDTNKNIMVDMDTLQRIFRNKKSEIMQQLRQYRLLDIDDKSRSNTQHYFLSTLEMFVVGMGCVIFIGALITALCISCIRRNKRYCYGANTFHTDASPGFTLVEPGQSKNTLQKHLLFPSFVGGNHSYDPAASLSGKIHQRGFSEHEPHCVRFHSYGNINPGSVSAGCVSGKRTPRRSTMGLETSATSLHSSGQDSGIVTGILYPCQCSSSSSPSSGESSNDYEDSLKSLQYQQRHQQQRNELQLQNHQQRSQSHDSWHDSHNDNNNLCNTQLLHKQHRFHSFTNLESIHKGEPSINGLHRNRRFQTVLLGQKHHHGDAFNNMTPFTSAMHRRSYSEAENLNIMETFMQEHTMSPKSLGSFGTLPTESSKFLCSKGKEILPAGAAKAVGGIPTLLRSSDSKRVIYARPKRNFT